LWYSEASSNYGWAINWQFDSLPADGFIAQEVYIRIYNAAGIQVQDFGPAYEYWPVRAGSTQTLLQGEFGHGPDDTLGQRVPGGYSGSMAVNVSASLWVNATVPDDAYAPPNKNSPPSSDNSGAFRPSASLRSSYFSPPFTADPSLSVNRGYSQPLR
jgi:hypothetical protein